MSKARNLADSYTDSEIDNDVIDAKAGRKNLIINGGFDVWQRGNSSIIANGYGSADRWKQYTAGVGGATFSKDSNGNMQITVTGSGNGTARVGQIVEFPEKYHGKTITFSAMVKSNNPNARLLIDSNTQWYTETDTHSGNSDWEQLKITATIESSGLTLLRFTVGLDGYQSANVNLTSSDYVSIKDVQLELGSQATDFEYRSYGEELALCQRYYQNLIDHDNGITGYASPMPWSPNAYGHMQYVAHMRVIPSVSILNGAGIVFSGGTYSTQNISLASLNGSTMMEFQFSTGTSGFWRSDTGCKVSLDAEL